MNALYALLLIAAPFSPMETPSSGTSAPEVAVLPIGCSPKLSELVKHIAEKTEAKDFAAAKATCRALPTSDPKIEWDDSGAPAASRFDFADQRDKVFYEWRNAVGGSSYDIVKKNGDIRVVFTKTPGMQLEWTESAPRLTVKIGPGEGGEPLNPIAFHNKFSFAIGSYFGVTQLPFPGFVMTGAEIPTPALLGLKPIETNTASACIIASRKLTEMVKRSQVVSSNLPSVAEEQPPVKIGEVLQGTQQPMAFTIKNSGGGELWVRIIPDCTCFSTNRSMSVAPGQSAVTHAQMDTTEFFGPIHKTLYLFSNDPIKPIQAIPVDITITPRYRILPTSHVVIAEEGENKVQAFLYTPNDHKLALTGATVSGLPAEVTYEPWEGEMADPDRGEGTMLRKGYKIVLTVKSVPSGLQMGTNVVFTTDDPTFPRINYQVFFQKGILAIPSNLFLGEIGASVRKMNVNLIRPGKPFKITAIESSSPSIKAAYTLVKPGEYKIAVDYDGKAVKGDYSATISVHTDDPKQPLIEIPVSAHVQ